MLKKILLMTFSLSSIAGAQNELTWEQLRDHYETPQWFADAKFGVWAHWGAQSKPAMGGGWYARHMYMQDVGSQQFGKNAYSYHQKHYGHQSKVGFKDVIHSWKAEKFDSDALLTYFKGIGARYFVAMANHHDHFDNFDSSHHPWNSVRVGPKRDIIGEFEKSARKHGLSFGVSSHDDRFLEWWLPAFGSDVDGPMKGVPYDGRLTLADGKGTWWEGLDPVRLYGLPPEKRTSEWLDEVGKNFVLRHQELVTKYQPDFLWFDGYGFPYEKFGQEVSAFYYNQSFKKHGKVKVAVSGKFVDEPSTLKDIERGVSDGILPHPWQGTTAFTGWFYKTDEPYKHNSRTLIEVLIDIVSKNGSLLLTVEMLPDGTVVPKQKEIVDKVGEWLRINGEAIYETRPWKIHGDNLNSIQRRLEGEAISNADIEALKKKGAKGHFNERTLNSLPYGSDEVRFTTKGDRLFVFVLNPKEGSVILPILGKNSLYQPKELKSVKLLGSDLKFEYEHNDEHLRIDVPAQRPSEFATVFEFKFNQ